MTEEEELIGALGEFAYDPYAFVMWAFPWGEAGTELADETGPDEWQATILCAIRDGIITMEQAMLFAVTSGHGVGKSALVSWLVWWSYSTFPGTRGVVTANTENQLKTKTWVEIAKWHRLFIAKHLFKCTATAIFSIDEDVAREWRIDIVPWSERNTEAFAGLHNAGKRIIVVFDEGSAIPDIIWEVTEGALTDLDTEILWFVFGNPTRNTGRFRECFDGGRFAHRWFKLKVDSRSVKRTNKKQLQQWIDDYGLDSDFVRVRILGEFPRTDAVSFISRDLAAEATRRELDEEPTSGIVLGVDVARFGDDLSVIWPRQGRDGASLPIQFYQGLDTQQFAAIVVRTYHSLGAVAACIDGGGVGGGVVDACRAAGIRVFEVQFGARADGFDPSAKYMNKRAEIWGQMRAWLKTGRIPPRAADRDLIDEFTAPAYSITGKDMIQLESKDMMKRRGAASPDFADALACTFAFPFAEHATSALPQTFTTDYNPHAEAYLHA